MAARSVFPLWVALAMGVFSPAAVGQPNSPDSALDRRCNGAIYRFLPGDFNYCLAVRMWGKQKYQEAETLLLLAAGWGSKPAQYALGIAYFNGDGVAKNRPLGLAWLQLSAERGDVNYTGMLGSANAAASPEEREAANVMLARLQDRYRDDVAASRAKRKYVREVAAAAGNRAYHSGLCIEGLNSGPLIAESQDGASCPSVEQTVAMLDQLSERYFQGWQSTVKVGPVAPVSTPPSSPDGAVRPDAIDH